MNSQPMGTSTSVAAVRPVTVSTPSDDDVLVAFQSWPEPALEDRLGGQGLP